MSFNLNYDRLIFLDAESLAESGIHEAYQSLLPELGNYLSHAAPIEEMIDNSIASYSVTCGMKKFVIYSPELNEEKDNSWGRATFAFFTIINDQLTASNYRFYAINGGNDLAGLFLTPAQALAAQSSLPNRRDWPYLPTSEAPWYGQFH